MCEGTNQGRLTQSTTRTVGEDNMKKWADKQQENPIRESEKNKKAKEKGVQCGV